MDKVVKYSFFGLFRVDVSLKNSYLMEKIEFQFKNFRTKRDNREIPTIIVSDKKIPSEIDHLIKLKMEKNSMILTQKNSDYYLNISKRISITHFNYLLLTAMRFVLMNSRFSICHAALVGTEGEGSIIFGEAGSGKTALAIEKAHKILNGKVHSDDYCFISEDGTALPFPRYFVVKINNFQHFDKHLSCYEKFLLKIWSNKYAFTILSKLPSRFGQDPVVKINNFTYEATEVPRHVRVTKFLIKNKKTVNNFEEYINKVNINEFTQKSLDTLFKNWKISFSELGQEKLDKLTEFDKKTIKSLFAIKGDNFFEQIE